MSQAARETSLAKECQKFERGLRGTKYHQFIIQLEQHLTKIFTGPVDRIVNAQWYGPLDELKKELRRLKGERNAATAQFATETLDAAEGLSESFPDGVSKLAAGGFKAGIGFLKGLVKFIEERRKINAKMTKVLHLEDKLRQAFFDEKMLQFLDYYTQVRGRSIDVEFDADFLVNIGLVVKDLVRELSYNIFMQYFFILQRAGDLVVQQSRRHLTPVPGHRATLPQLIVANMAKIVFQMPDVKHAVQDQTSGHTSQFKQAAVMFDRSQWTYVPRSTMTEVAEVDVSARREKVKVVVQTDAGVKKIDFTVKGFQLDDWFQKAPRMYVTKKVEGGLYVPGYARYKLHVDSATLIKATGGDCEELAYPPLVLVTDVSQGTVPSADHDPYGHRKHTLSAAYGQLVKTVFDPNADKTFGKALELALRLNNLRHLAMRARQAGAEAGSGIGAIAHDRQADGAGESLLSEIRGTIAAGQGGGGGGAAAPAPAPAPE